MLRKSSTHSAPGRRAMLKKPLADLFFFFLLICFSASAQQPVKELRPSSVKIIDLTAQGEKLFNKNLEAYRLINKKLEKGATYEELTEEEQKVMNEYEMSTNYWDIPMGVCNWYCGGGPTGIEASSALKPQGDNKYDARHAHDFDYKDAWIEGVPGYGIGEFLVYKFKAESPRITKILVVNGYVKNQSAWENNSRVKKLKVSVNDQPVAILNLEDKRATQTFEVEPIGNGNRKDLSKLTGQPDWSLKFEIMEVYKGLKYDDVAISEIYFDGIDVH